MLWGITGQTVMKVLLTACLESDSKFNFLDAFRQKVVCVLAKKSYFVVMEVELVNWTPLGSLRFG